MSVLNLGVRRRGAGTDASFVLSSRAVVAVGGMLVVLAAGVRLLSGDAAWPAAFKVVTATLAIGLVPGTLLTLAWRPRPQLSALETVGFGIALSFGIAHLLTMLAISVHASPDASLAIVVVVSLALAVRAWRVGSCSVHVTVDDLILLALLVVLAVPLYLQGSPFDVYEDQVLVAIMRRLTELGTPRLDNLYVVPGIVYTYPFPGLLYLMALAARLADVDPLFVYHKLRFFWGPAALVMLYLVALRVFGRSAVAYAVAVTAVVFIAAGTFGMVAGFPAWWGGLTPYSYVPDVAMTVLLPGLLALAFGYLQSDQPREMAFFLTGTAMLLLMLTIIHIREIVQFVAYVGCFAVVGALFRSGRPHLRRAVTLLVLTLGVVAIYMLWQARIANIVADVVGTERAQLASVVAGLSIRQLVVQPAVVVLPDFVQDFDEIFAGLTPFFLVAGPAVVLLFRQRPLVWLISASTLAYLAIMSVPLLAIPYIYLTYFEILQIPVRNIILFVYLFAGAALYAAAVALMRIDRTKLSLPVSGLAGGVVALLMTLSLNRSYLGFFVPMIAAYGLTLVALVGARPGRPSRARTLVAAVVAAVALILLWPDHAPIPREASVNVRWTAGLPDARREALEKQFGLTNGERTANYSAEVNVWGYRLTDLSTDNVKALVTHQDVVDTNDIDRSTFTVPAQAPRTDHPFFGLEHAAWLQYPGTLLLVATGVVAWVFGIIVPLLLAARPVTQALSSFDAGLGEPFYRRAVPYALLLVPFAIWSARPSLSPFALAPMPPVGRADTPQALMAQIPCLNLPRTPARFAEEEVILPERMSCPPDPALVAWARTHVPVDGVFAVDRWTAYPPQVFMPQQAVVFPTLDASFLREDSLFRAYYHLFDDRIRRYRVQPFFNAVETPTERLAFVKDLGVTHVLVSPAHYAELRPVLDGLARQFLLKYDHAQWAIYEVTSVGD